MLSYENEKHLDVYDNRYELYQDGKKTVYRQGFQNIAAQKRYEYIKSELEKGFLEKTLQTALSADFRQLSERNRILLLNMVSGITSEVGRALVGLVFLQLTIKSISPEQCIRLHKGATRKGSFSWVEGVSMRTIDSTYNTPFLRNHGLLNLNNYGLFMTRSLAENYPYTSLYKADMKGAFKDWINIVDAIENNSMPAKLSLCYLMALLQNRSVKFKKDAEQACQLVDLYLNENFESIKNLLIKFFNNTSYSARAFEITIHGLFQALQELSLLGDYKLVPLSQMRSANKKHKNIGDIELVENGIILESWDAKYGKPYLRDELEELRDKLLLHSECQIAGFVTNSDVDCREDIRNRMREISDETSTCIYIFNFNQWSEYQLSRLTIYNKNALGYRWLKATVESFAQRRPCLAPIDEPCDVWINDLISCLENF